ncbi:hypothetical protein TrRE_jg549, partial [Triparma retinervis]
MEVVIVGSASIQILNRDVKKGSATEKALKSKDLEVVAKAEASHDNSFYPTQSVIAGNIKEKTANSFATDLVEHTTTTPSGNLQVKYNEYMYTGYSGAEIITQDANKNNQSK